MRRSYLGRAALIAATFALTIAGCAAGPGGQMAATSIQQLEYYPFQVKGYQGSYPDKTMVVLMPADARNVPGSAPLNGDPQTGIVLGQDGKIAQRLYSEPLGPIVQKAIAQSATEAGLTATASNAADYRPEAPAPFQPLLAKEGAGGQQAGTGPMHADYVLASKIVKCWAIKRRGPGNENGPLWQTQAEAAIEVSIYKPPFSAPFWHWTSADTYFDPPVGSFGLGSADEAGIYDDPGEVLSVALTRAVAGIFEDRKLHELIFEDRLRAR